MTEQDMINLKKEVEELMQQKSETSDFGEQMALADRIHNIQMKLNGVKPMDSYFECEGCGS